MYTQTLNTINRAGNDSDYTSEYRGILLTNTKTHDYETNQAPH